MRFLAALLLLALAGPAAAANFTRTPEVGVLVYGGNTENGKILWATVRPILEAYGVRPVLVLNTTDANQQAILMPHGNQTVTAKSARLFGRTGYMGDEWKLPKDLDGWVFIGYDWRFVGSGVRLDSLSIAALYAQVPQLSIGNTSSFSTFGGIDSIGMVGGTSNITRAASAGSFTGTNYQIGLPSALAGETGSIVPSGYPGVTRLLESTTGGDTVYVWRRNFGNNQGSMTCVNTAQNGGNLITNNDIASIITGVESFVSQFPDSVRPKRTFEFALHIDDGMKRDDSAAGGGIQPDQVANMAAARDSLVSRRIKYTLGVENSTDTLNVVDSGTTYTRFVRDYLIWNSDYAKFTPHSHAAMGGRGGNLSLSGAFNDVFGGGRNRNCDPTAASDTTLYWAAKAQLDSLAARVGWAKIDRCVMPPTDDYSPLNINTSTCNLNGMLSSYRRAGYTAIRINTSASSNLANSSSDPAGYHSWQGWYGTDYGDIKLLSLGEGYAPGLASDSQDALTTSTRVSFPGSILKFFFVGQKGTLQSGLGTSGPISMPGAAIVVNHIRNYGGSQPGWMVVRDLDNMFRAWNKMAGYERYRWVWSAELNPVPITAP